MSVRQTGLGRGALGSEPDAASWPERVLAYLGAGFGPGTPGELVLRPAPRQAPERRANIYA